MNREIIKMRDSGKATSVGMRMFIPVAAEVITKPTCIANAKLCQSIKKKYCVCHLCI